jgi:hypothetical protein
MMLVPGGKYVGVWQDSVAKNNMLTRENLVKACWGKIEGGGGQSRFTKFLHSQALPSY